MTLRPKKLDVFVAWQFIMLFVGAFLICQFVLMMQFLWRYVDELIGKGLSLEVMAQFFWYMGLMLVPQALPLAILLSSLITFGNIGESSELTAIKAAGISLMQTFRGLIVLCVLICCSSFVFQNYVGPDANLKMRQLLLSMKQKSPELEIPEGIFYDGIPRSNIFVQKKDMKNGMLYGLTIYRMTGSYEDQAIILADSGMLQSTADKKHLLMTLWSGEWFENMKSQDLGNKAAVPYRRESFYNKQILIDFDGDFSMTDAAGLANDARSKGLPQLMRAVDSIENRRDSMGRATYTDMGRRFYQLDKKHVPPTATFGKQTTKAEVAISQNPDTAYAQLTDNERQTVLTNSISSVNSCKAELGFKAMVAEDQKQQLILHRVQEIGKFTLALQCLIFFFIGAPLGAIIRKGGLGLPVIVSVLVFIIYYILENSGTRMVKIGAWNLWFGCLLSTAVLTPLAVYVTYKANNDAIVFNLDAVKEALMRLLGLRSQRHIYGKEVIIDDPDYASDAQLLTDINEHIASYVSDHNLVRLPNVAKVFFKYQPDHEVERINETLEKVIDDLSNTRDKAILANLNRYPIIATKAHTRPFEKRWRNIVAAVIIPVGIFFYIRMGFFRLRLYRDLQVISHTNKTILGHIGDIKMT